jgi:aminopeptidase N
LAEAELVRTWFGWRVPLRLETETLLGPGLGMFAVALAAEARGGQDARRLEIVRLLADYDRARVPGDDGSLLRSPAESTPQQRAADALKAALFLAALDDLAGQDNFETAVRRLQDAMAGRGLSLSLDDLRSALESTAGTAMADVFRLWLNRPGIPDDFRARYSQASAAASGAASATVAPGAATAALAPGAASAAVVIVSKQNQVAIPGGRSGLQP